MSHLQTDLIEQNEDIEKDFLRDFINSNDLKDTICFPIATSEFYKFFMEYRNRHGLEKFEYSQKKFTLQMKIYNLEDLKDCVEWKQTKKGKIFVIDFGKIYKDLGMDKLQDEEYKNEDECLDDCLITDDEEDCLSESDE